MRKTLTGLLLSFFLVALFSCGKDKDNNPPSVKNKLTGTWNGDIQYELEYKDDVLTYGDTTKIQDPHYFRLTFTAEKEFNIRSFIAGAKDSESGKYKIEGNQLTFIDKGADAETYTYKVSEGTLELTSTEEEQVNGHTTKEVERILFRK